MVIPGDIRNVDRGYIVHQVNCQGHIGAGVSGVICEKWPAVRRSYERACAGKTPQERFGQCVGTVVSHNADGSRLVVVNSFSQLDYGDAARTHRVYTDEDVLIDNVRRVVEVANREGKAVFVPDHIGCGLAGGNWERVRPALEEMGVVIVTPEDASKQKGRIASRDNVGLDVPVSWLRVREGKSRDRDGKTPLWDPTLSGEFEMQRLRERQQPTENDENDKGFEPDL